MGKDPAVLWYWSDWNSGTSTLSRFLKGCYMDLLHAQFNSGRLSISEIKTVLGTDFGQAWPTLQKKFKQDESDLYYNERAELEKIKRESFVSSRRKNLESPHMKQHMDRHMVEHMEPHMENRNRNENKDLGKGGLGEKDLQTWDENKQLFLNDGNWIFKFCRDKRLTQSQFKMFAEEFLSDLELKEDYKPIKEIRRHFTNWFNKTKILMNGGNSPVTHGPTAREIEEAENRKKIDQL